MAKRKSQKLTDKDREAIKRIMKNGNINFGLARNVYMHKYSIAVAIKKQKNKNMKREKESQKILAGFRRISRNILSR